MNELSFGIKNSEMLFAKLLAEYKDFNNDITDSRTAINCAMTAWHLTDWVYYEFEYKISKDFLNISLFQNHLKTLCPSLQIMHDLTNGIKHYKLTRHQTKVKETTLHKGSFGKGFGKGFDISCFVIKMNDGSNKYFNDEIELVINFWNDYLHNNYNIKNITIIT